LLAALALVPQITVRTHAAERLRTQKAQGATDLEIGQAQADSDPEGWEIAGGVLAALGAAAVVSGWATYPSRASPVLLVSGALAVPVGLFQLSYGMAAGSVNGRVTALASPTVAANGSVGGAVLIRGSF
jgi:hypothetical protein